MTGSTKNTNYLLGSSIGRKFLMGLTGLFLVTFLLVHCFINAMVFFDGTGALFNDYAHFMGTNIIIRIMEVGLFGGLLAHIIDGLWLWKLNNDARPEKYAYSQPNANSKWYSRSMGLLGTLLLIFLILHDLYAEMFTVVANPIVVAIYVLAQFSLGFHLLHGFQSAFQSLGLNHTKYNALIKTVGAGFAILIPFIFALMPIVIYLRH